MTSLDTVLDKDGVRLTVDDAVATVTLTNPAKRNAQSPALWRALTEAGRALPGTVRVVVLRGEGMSFSAGLDRQAFTPEGFDGEPSFLDMARGPEAELDATIAEYQEAFTWWRRNDLVSIAAVQGHAIGATSSSPSPAICASSPRTCSSPCARPASASFPTSRAPTPWCTSWGMPARSKSAPPAASSTPRRPNAPASPTSWSPPTSSTRRPATWPGPWWRRPRRRRRDEGTPRRRALARLRGAAHRRAGRPGPLTRDLAGITD